jgi:hypothetical protein
MRSSCSAYSWMMCTEASVEPSSRMMNSKSSHVCDRTLSSANFR